MKATAEKIQHLRMKIDEIDTRILRLLNKRAEIACLAGKMKSQQGFSAYDPAREEEILNRLISENQGPFPDHSLSFVFREVLSACRGLEAELSVAYLGPPASYSHVACLRHFGTSIRAVPVEGILDVFDGVEKKRVTYGVIPVENSNEGSVNVTLDALMESEVRICGEVLLRISHSLLSRCKRVEEVRKVYSHPQALGQCRNWLRKNLDHAEQVETASTAKATEIAAGERNAAAIASSFAGRFYDLRALASEIEDHSNNFTRFLILGQERCQKTGKDKTSLLFSIPHRSGSLFSVLKPFAQRKINLTRIESRPVKNRPWEYVFFLDLEGHELDRAVQSALEELERKVLFLKLLGSYPRGRSLEG